MLGERIAAAALLLALAAASGGALLGRGYCRERFVRCPCLIVGKFSSVR